jgi:hypothetical protein
MLLDPQQDAFGVVEKLLSRKQIEGLASTAKSGGKLGLHGEPLTVSYYGGVLPVSVHEGGGAAAVGS